MTQRTIAALLAVPMVIALLVAAWTRPLPYVTYEPGLTVDVLGQDNGREIIQVQGHRTYRDDGELRMTTVYVSRPRADIRLYELMTDWLSRKDAVYPYDAVYQQNETDEDSKTEGAVDMVSSQDAAVAVALHELGFQAKPAIEVLFVDPGSPADGRLRVRDIFLRVNGQKITDADQLKQAISGTEPGEAVHFTVLRDGRHAEVSVVPEEDEGEPRVGIQLGGGFIFPFEVEVNINPDIGGPSAGLMFSLGIYDTLTPGSLTGGQTVAGTGTIDASGKVGPIGGIQQKIAGASGDGAELFLVPPDNCKDAIGAQNGDMRLVKAPTMHSAVESIQAWVEDPNADLPSCKDAS
jgi:PDZ domain-containing protein